MPKSKKNYLFPIFCLFVVLASSPCTAQEKYEREYGIKPNAVPESAREFILSVFKKAKIHWYGEEALTGKSIEAKLKHSGKRYSVEFDESGKIQDIEILSTLNQIPEKSRKALLENLGKEFSKHRIVKTQVQWTGSESALKRAILNDQLPQEIVTRYELVVRATKDKKESYYEVLSEDNGTLIHVRQIIQRNADNLIY